MAPVRTQHDQCESVVSRGAIKRSLHIGNGIRKGPVQAAILIRSSGADRTEHNTKANCQRDDASQT